MYTWKETLFTLGSWFKIQEQGNSEETSSSKEKKGNYNYNFTTTTPSLLLSSDSEPEPYGKIERDLVSKWESNSLKRNKRKKEILVHLSS